MAELRRFQGTPRGPQTRSSHDPHGSFLRTMASLAKGIGRPRAAQPRVQPNIALQGSLAGPPSLHVVMDDFPKWGQAMDGLSTPAVTAEKTHCLSGSQGGLGAETSGGLTSRPDVTRRRPVRDSVGQGGRSLSAPSGW